MKNHQKMKLFSPALALCLCAALLSGCQTKQSSAPAQSSSASTSAPAAPDVSQTTDSSAATDSSATTDSSAATDGGLYIFLGGEDYTCYPASADASPDELVAEIASLTGWELTLADEITTGKGGMTVSFAKTSCLFVGPPEEQNADFFVYDAAQLTFSVLDSVQKTLQAWASPTNPDSVDIYFCMEGDVPLELDTLGVTLPMDEPYSHDALEALLAG
jgi:hypothetical protein